MVEFNYGLLNLIRCLTLGICGRDLVSELCSWYKAEGYERRLRRDETGQNCPPLSLDWHMISASADGSLSAYLNAALSSST